MYTGAVSSPSKSTFSLFKCRCHRLEPFLLCYPHLWSKEVGRGFQDRLREYSECSHWSNGWGCLLDTSSVRFTGYVLFRKTPWVSQDPQDRLKFQSWSYNPSGYSKDVKEDGWMDSQQQLVSFYLPWFNLLLLLFALVLTVSLCILYSYIDSAANLWPSP